MASLLKKLTRLQTRRPRTLLTISRILEWADAHHAATGRWPSSSSGQVGQSRFGTSWKAIDLALSKGLHGTPCLSLAILLHERRGKKLRVDVEKERSPVGTRRWKRAAHVGDRETLSVERILAWADAHQAATGRWPTTTSGPIIGVPGDNWRTIADALREGRRGLPGGTTLTRLLTQHRGSLGPNRPANLTVRQILSWADDYYQTHGCWPSERYGKVAGAPGETWPGIDRRLREGGRSLPGGSSLTRLLAEHRGTRNPSSLPDLSITQIVAWADAHHAATGKWPHSNSGAVRGAPGESWNTINEALRGGRRGLPGGLSLSRLLDEHRPKRSRRLTRQKILAWAEAHRAATGVWPNAKSGAVAGAPDETWNKINQALRYGHRGFPSGSSLSRLLDRPPARRRPALTLDQVLAWGEAHHAATGRWPVCESGAIAGAPGENWKSIDNALRHGLRGLPGGLSLKQLFASRRAPSVTRKRGRSRSSASKSPAASSEPRGSCKSVPTFPRRKSPPAPAVRTRATFRAHFRGWGLGNTMKYSTAARTFPGPYSAI